MYVNTTIGECSRFLYYSKDCARDGDRKLGNLGDNRCGLGSAVCCIETNSNFADTTGKFLDIGIVYLCDKCGVDYIDGEDRARICGEKFWNSLACGRGFGSSKRGFGKIKVKKNYFALLELAHDGHNLVK
jgi:hypothetical protein